MDSVLLMVQVGMSVFFGTPAIIIILSKRYQPREKHWAYSTLGIILGVLA